MKPYLSLVTLGVSDVARARRFYEALGFIASGDSNEAVAFFDAGGVALAIFGREELAKDAGIATAVSDGFSGVTLAHNVAEPNSVDRVLQEAVDAGGRLIKPAQNTFWGGYAGYFADPDGHLWEVAHNPFWEFGPDGRISLPASKDVK